MEPDKRSDTLHIKTLDTITENKSFSKLNHMEGIREPIILYHISKDKRYILRYTPILFNWDFFVKF